MTKASDKQEKILLSEMREHRKKNRPDAQSLTINELLDESIKKEEIFQRISLGKFLRKDILGSL